MGLKRSFANFQNWATQKHALATLFKTTHVSRPDIVPQKFLCFKVFRKLVGGIGDVLEKAIETKCSKVQLFQKQVPRMKLELSYFLAKLTFLVLIYSSQNLATLSLFWW